MLRRQNDFTTTRRLAKRRFNSVDDFTTTRRLAKRRFNSVEKTQYENCSAPFRQVAKTQ